MIVSADANILVYAVDIDAGSKHDVARRVLTDAISTDFALSEQSLVEFLNATITKRKQFLRSASEAIAKWTALFPVMHSTAVTLDTALSLLASFKLSVWDAHMLAVCAGHSCDILLSEDMQDGGLYGTVRVLNPFDPSNAALLHQAFAK